ncbi:MAG: alpha/beta hydrolase [Promethearchaeia archaeon]|nr:MAG: alpha/beta hydrolase [Candidatus Lokiarchaeia archaeon]
MLTKSIWFEKIGQGIPIIFIHGLGVDHRTLSLIFEPFFKSHPQLSFQRIYLDLPGMGNTPILPKIHSSDDILALLEIFIKNTIGTKPFLLVGESYGGYLAQGLIFRLSSQILGSILICPVVIPELSKRTLPPSQIISETPGFRNTLTPSELKEYLRSTTVISAENWAKFSKLIYSAYQTVNKPFVSQLFRENYRLSVSIDSSSKLYSFPLLMLLGKQDSTVGYQDHFSIIEKFPQISYFIIDRAGHNLLIEQTTIICKLIEWYLLQNFPKT